MTDVVTTSERPAQEVWAEEAHAVLETVASTYGGLITSKQLGDKIQASSGITTRSLVQNWIGPVLESVSQQCRTAGEPALTSLVVNKTDGRVGEVYDKVVVANGEPKPADNDARDEHAAASRLACYRHFAADVPAGARPALSPTLQSTHDRERKLRLSLVEAKRCKTCNVELSRTGMCDSCDY